MRFQPKALPSAIFAILSASAVAGNLTPSAGPDSSASAMYGLDDIYHRLNSGAAGSKRTGAFTEPTAGPAPTGFTLDQIMAKAPVVDDAAGVTGAHVLQGETYWSLRSSGWGKQTGSMANQGGTSFMPDTANQSIPAGYYDGTGTVAGDSDLAADNIRRDVSIFGVTGTLDPTAGTALAEHVLSSVTFSSTAAGTDIQGTMPNATGDITPGKDPVQIPQGYHDGTGNVVGDQNLVPGNIRRDTVIFGVTGDLDAGISTVDATATPADLRVAQTAYAQDIMITGTRYPAPVAQTGETECFDGDGNSIGCAGTGQDGEYQAGIMLESSRFTDNGDGTILDNLTGLVWLKEIGCPSGLASDGITTGKSKTWLNALSFAVSISDGDCGLTDGSVDGVWRLPNVNELMSLIDHRYAGPALARDGINPPFLGNTSAEYWTSTNSAHDRSMAHIVAFQNDGGYRRRAKSSVDNKEVFAVKGGAWEMEYLTSGDLISQGVLSGA